MKNSLTIGLLGLMLLSVCPWAFGQSADSGAPQDPFGKAEFLFYSGKYREAQESYQQFLQEFPNHSNISRALFRLGQIDFEQKSYNTALRYFNLVTNRYPDTRLIDSIRFYSGRCQFEIGNYSKAEELLRKTLDIDPDILQRWKAVLYLGMIDDRKFDYENAIIKLHHVYKNSGHDDLKLAAKKEIEMIVNEKLDEKRVLDLSGKFQVGFPADLLSLRLQSIYRLNGETEKYRLLLQEFIRHFPGHPEFPTVQANLKQVRDIPSSVRRLGAILPLTGKYALTGQQVLQGIQLAWNELTIEERERLQLDVKDSGVSKSVQKVYEEAARDPGMLAVIGPVFSESVKGLVPSMEEFQLPVFTPTASLPGLPDLSPYIFRNAMTKENQSRYLAEMAVNQLNLHRFVVLYPEETYGVLLRDHFVEEVEALGAEVVTSVSYNRSQTDFKKQIFELGGMSDNQLKKVSRENLEKRASTHRGKPYLSRPVIEKGLWNDEEDVENIKVNLELGYDAIFIPGFYDRVALIVPQLIFYNVDEVTLLGANGWNSPKLVKNAGRYLKESYFVDGFFENSQSPGVQDFVQKFKTSFGEAPTLLSAQAYDATRMLIRLIRKGAKSRKAITEGLHKSQGFDGVSGRTRLLPSGESHKDLYVLQVRQMKIVEVQ